MADSKIEWTEKVWNPVTGCTPVSEGCANCYAKRMANRLRGRYGYPADDPFRVTFHPDKLDEPLHWKKPRRVFVCSMSDIFHPAIPPEILLRLFDVMCSEQGEKHIFQILTKRPERWHDLEWFATESWPGDSAFNCQMEVFNHLPNNIWLGVTAENQRTADERIPILLQIPAAVRFVSVEPMLEAMDIERYVTHCDDCGNRGSTALFGNRPGSGSNLCHDACSKHGEGPALDWVICGGESGPGKRPFTPDWARDLRDQCKDAGVPFFMKQVDKRIPIPDDLMIREWPR